MNQNSVQCMVCLRPMGEHSARESAQCYGLYKDAKEFVRLCPHVRFNHDKGTCPDCGGMQSESGVWEAPVSRFRNDKPTMVAIIGSSRFRAQHAGAAQRETLLGKIVLTPGFFHHVDMVPITSVQKEKLDKLMLYKILLADEVLVVNVNGYVGESTRTGIVFADRIGKPIRYLET